MSRNIIAVVDDLFFASKIRGTAEQVGIQVTFPRGIDAVIEAARHDQPSLVLCDLHAQKIDTTELARALKADESTRRIHLLGFFSHVQTELHDNAEQAGFDRVIPRSALAKNLMAILSGSE
jgi:CheY-like chemotaxis protein